MKNGPYGSVIISESFFFLERESRERYRERKLYVCCGRENKLDLVYLFFGFSIFYLFRFMVLLLLVVVFCNVT